MQLKNTIYEIKNSVDGINSRLEMMESKIGILKDSSIYNIKAC